MGTLGPHKSEDNQDPTRVKSHNVLVDNKSQFRSIISIRYNCQQLISLLKYTLRTLNLECMCTCLFMCKPTNQHQSCSETNCSCACQDENDTCEKLFCREVNVMWPAVERTRMCSCLWPPPLMVLA